MVLKDTTIFIPAYLNFISDTNEEYNYYAEQITKITEGNFEVEKEEHDIIMMKF